MLGSVQNQLGRGKESVRQEATLNVTALNVVVSPVLDLFYFFCPLLSAHNSGRLASVGRPRLAYCCGWMWVTTSLSTDAIRLAGQGSEANLHVRPSQPRTEARGRGGRRRWWQLPEMNRWAKMPLLRSMQQVVELQESRRVLVDIGNTTPGHAFGDLTVRRCRLLLLPGGHAPPLQPGRVTCTKNKSRPDRGLESFVASIGPHLSRAAEASARKESWSR